MSENENPIAVEAARAPSCRKASNHPEPFASRMGGREKRPLGHLFGLSHFGVNLTRLAPNAMSALRHAHSRQDEFVYILEGIQPCRRIRGRCDWHPACALDSRRARGRPTTYETAEDVVYLEIGDRTPGDEVTYADDDIPASLVNGESSHPD